MCSVRHRPIPSAPNARAFLASVGLSAFARTRSRRSSSDHSSTVWNCSEISGSISATSSVVTVPADPSIASWSPAFSSRPSTDTVCAERSMSSADTPQTHGRPIPRATSAACEALPPSEVRMPRAAWNPATSSASVKGRTRITSSPSPPRFTASSAVNTIAPLAAPGDAAMPSREHVELRVRVEGGMEQRVELPGVDRRQRRPAVEQPFADRVDGEAHSGLRGALRVARLEQVEPLLLDRELGVLHVPVMGLERLQGPQQLLVRLRQHPRHLVEALGVADTRHHVLALRVRPGSRPKARAPP